ncbi:MAG: trigger factor [Bryobacterales bacterium]
MATTDVTRGELEITVPWDEVQKESDRVLQAFRKQVRVPGFRPGKAPDSVIKMRYAEDIKAEVLEKLIGRHFWAEAEEQDYRVIGTPKVRDVKFEDDQPLEFTAEFEMIPDFELADYKRLQAPFKEPEVTDEEIERELEQLRERHASFKNLDPRPLEKGDIAVIALKSDEVEGAPTIDQNETTITIGGEETFEEFTKALEGKTPGDKVDFDVNYPEDFGNEQLAGKTIPFHAEVKAIRVKELPELDDDFASEVGDFQTLDELKKRIQEEIHGHKRSHAVEHAKEKLIDQLVEKHPFPVPDLLVNEQIRSRLERMARTFAAQGVDLENTPIDWKKLGEDQRERAARDVKAGLLLERISEVEAIEADQAGIDAEVQRFAQRNQLTLAGARRQLAEDGTLDRIESHLKNEKTMNFLFDEAEKVDPPEEPEEEASAEPASEPAAAEEPKQADAE